MTSRIRAGRAAARKGKQREKKENREPHKCQGKGSMTIYLKKMMKMKTSHRHLDPRSVDLRET